MGLRVEPNIESKSLLDFRSSADKETEDAVEQALTDNDIQSIFFVNQISENQSTRTLANLNANNYYSFARVERTVYDKVKQGDLPKDNSLESSSARSSYRVRLFDFLIQSHPWLAIDGQSSRSPKDLPAENYHHDKALYQGEIYKVLTSFTYPEGVSARLEMTANSIAEIFTLTRDVEPSTKRFWVLISYLRDSGSTLRPVLRTYQFVFETSQGEERPVVAFSYNFYAAILNEEDFETARSGIDQRLIELGERLTEQKSSDIYLPALASEKLRLKK
ncbi:hypothetical protein DSL72_009504 [Monilinia vaccinii-corymbosi]|uniref:Uncharacterized protein n=1 Tax=Monilinia vaccinii-corymbosi TaxID=61207 RepID=A0A8A3PRJ5_9HELO|nr:hypothetical protein DSL72_009504 [Monilinia vaccinii-corymbosi]